VYNSQPKDIPNGTLHPCLILFKGIWPVFDALLNFDSTSISISICKALHSALKVHGLHFQPIAAEVAPQIAAAYERSKVCALMWAASRLVIEFGDASSEDGMLMYSLVESMSRTTFQIIQDNATKMNDISDGGLSYTLTFH
jgi:hypothetical protein